jgi:hypothetical protein
MAWGRKIISDGLGTPRRVSGRTTRGKIVDWNHIQDKQPKKGQKIVKVDPEDSYGHRVMGFVTYSEDYDLVEMKKYYSDYGYTHPEFWWIPYEDFNFPDQPERSKRDDSGDIPEMRCSELCGDTERLAEKTSPPGESPVSK